jgi:hypothetical protein
MDSILTSIKKMLGIAEEYEHFDMDLIIHINTVLSVLAQLGVGSSQGFAIQDKTATWGDVIPAGMNLELIKSYVFLKVRLLFDPPSNSSVIKSSNKLINELEWRINIEVDPAADGEV